MPAMPACLLLLGLTFSWGVASLAIIAGPFSASVCTLASHRDRKALGVPKLGSGKGGLVVLEGIRVFYW